VIKSEIIHGRLLTVTHTLGWLHISDLHFLDKHAWRDSQPLKKMLDDLEVLLNEGLRIDLVLCTGDIGFGETRTQPLAAQYDDAKFFFDRVLEICRLGRDRLFLVPGNHDIDRSRVLDSQTEWFRSRARSPEQINQKFQDAHAEITHAMARLDPYRQFITNHYPHIKLDNGATYGAQLEINGISIAITGLNSAWTCADDKDKNQMWLAGEAQLHASNKSVDARTGGTRPHLRLGLLHHPQDWLQPTEAQQLRGRLQQEFDFLLHGHAHDQWVHEITTPQHIVIAAGATTGESLQEFGYNLVQVAPGMAKVYLRRYDTKGCGWIEENIHGRTKHGVWPLTPLACLPAEPIASVQTAASQVPSGETPLSRGHFGLDAALQDCSRLLEKSRLLAVFGIAGVGKSTLVEELRLRPEWRNHRLMQTSAREQSGINDFFGQIAPLLGLHDERPHPPRGDTVSEMAEALRRMAPEAAPFFLHVQRAHLWLASGHWRDPNLARLLEGLSCAFPESAIVLETRERPETNLESFEVAGLPKQALANYLALPPGLPSGWTLKGDQRAYVYSRLGGGHGSGAHAYGLALLVRLAAAKYVSPYDILKEYPEDYSQDLYEKLFRDLYQNVLMGEERALLFACSLYRDGLHYSHLPRLEQVVSAPDSGAALIRRGLLKENAEWLHLHDLAAEQARKLATDDYSTQQLHRVIAGLWLGDLYGQKALIEANIRRALEALYHLEQGGEGERVAEIAPTLFGRHPEESVRALWRVEKRLHEQQQYGKVRTILEYLLKISPGDHQAMRFLGECRRKLFGSNDPEALVLFKQATRIVPEFPQYWSNFGHAAIASADKEVLYEFLREVAEAPERALNDYVKAIQASALEAAGRDDEASVLREDQIAMGSRNPAFYADHAKWLLEKKEDADAALKVVELARQRQCADDITDAVCARALEVAGRVDEAISLRQGRIAAGTRNHVLYADHAKWLLEKKGDADGALKVVEQARQQKCCTDFINAICVRALEVAGRNDEATSLRQEIIAAGTTISELYADHAEWLLEKKCDADAALKVAALAKERGCADLFTPAFYVRAQEMAGHPGQATKLSQERTSTGSHSSEL